MLSAALIASSADNASHYLYDPDGPSSMLKTTAGLADGSTTSCLVLLSSSSAQMAGSRITLRSTRIESEQVRGDARLIDEQDLHIQVCKSSRKTYTLTVSISKPAIVLTVIEQRSKTEVPALNTVDFIITIFHPVVRPVLR
jgi:hypothetical protein